LQGCFFGEKKKKKKKKKNQLRLGSWFNVEKMFR